MPIAKDFTDFLRLIDISGPFLSPPVMARTFGSAFEKSVDEPERRAALKLAYLDWEASEQEPEQHRRWILYVLRDFLGWPDEQLRTGQGVPPGLIARLPAQQATIVPDVALVDPANRATTAPARMLVSVAPPGQALHRGIKDHWGASPQTRMQELLRATDVRLGLVTNGEEWSVVHAPRGETTGFATWQAPLWFEEPLTLRAFNSLLDRRRFFAVPDEDTLAALWAESSKDQQEVTDRLGAQVRHSVEMLVAALDRLNRASGKTYLAGVSNRDLYEGCVTVMMRLVFLLSAEERGLLRLGESFYDENYAASTLLAQLREAADQHGEEVLERRHAAWARLLATFRAVHGGVEHEEMRLPAYGGSLFDPDRFPFLEGRLLRTPMPHWRDDPAEPPAIDDRTVLHLLDSLQWLEEKGERRRLSFRALDVEQIGHVYEGLLDHTVKTADRLVLGLAGAKNKEPELPLDTLEAWAKSDVASLDGMLAEETGRSTKALEKARAAAVTEPGLLIACDNDASLAARVRPFAGLLREDTFGRLTVIREGSRYVTSGSDRRSTGTHYTPRALTEEIVQHALDPLVYVGPAEGVPPAEWRLKSPREILALRVCDFAMGSGAFLVEACRYLAGKLIAAWAKLEADADGRLVITPEGDLSHGRPGERALPSDPDERLAIARRVVADRCLYGVDRNAMAVEMAKLSLWLVTLQKDKPFTFVDHALRCGDSLLGLTSENQLAKLHPAPEEGQKPFGFLSDDIRQALEKARKHRRDLEALGTERLEDVQNKQRLLALADEALRELKIVADLVIGAALASAGRGKGALRDAMETQAGIIQVAFQQEVGSPPRKERFAALRQRADQMLDEGRDPARHPERLPFHWVLEFPEVFEGERAGFDAFVGNPPFIGGQKITGAAGTDYRDYLVEYLGRGKRGSADLCAYFFLRANEALARNGCAGLIATNTIAQGDTREVGLDQLETDGASIYRAVPSTPWPGNAALEIAKAWIYFGAWQGPCELNAETVPAISAFLAVKDEVAGKPFRLEANEGKSFQGSIVLGMGFVLTPEEAQALIAKAPRNQNVLLPYLNGEDLNSRPDQSASRWVINFRDWPLDRASAPAGYVGPVAADYPDCLAIVEAKVKPERQRRDANGEYVLRRPLPERWWHYAEKRPELYRTIAHMPTVIITPRVSKYVAFATARAGIVVSEQIVVIASDSTEMLGLLNSSMHVAWTQQHQSSLETRGRYTPSDCFETFPVVAAMTIGSAAQTFVTLRSECARKHGGLTKALNAFHDPSLLGSEWQAIRAAFVSLDLAVRDAYGWTDIDLEHGFHETKQGVRFTLSERARKEMLRRLLKLNHERYAEEVAAGLHESKKKAGAKAAPKAKTPKAIAPTPVGDLFSAMPATAKPERTLPAKPLDAGSVLLAALQKAQPRALGKAELLEVTGLDDAAWGPTIKALVAEGKVVQAGEKRGAKYRAT